MQELVPLYKLPQIHVNSGINSNIVFFFCWIQFFKSLLHFKISELSGWDTHTTFFLPNKLVTFKDVYKDLHKKFGDFYDVPFACINILLF